MRTIIDGKTLAEWVPVIVEQLVREFEPLRIVLFGSVARGDDGPDSDIDLMVVLPSLDYARRHEWMSRYRGAVTAPLALDVFVTDEREWQRRRDVIGSMHYWPAREGRLVYGRAA